MDKLRDLRVNLQLDVKVWGLDASGNPFRHVARTVEIGALGARISGISGVQENDVIGVQHGNEKARFRVVWTGAPGSEQQGLVGVECVEPGKCIWTAALESAQSTTSAAGQQGLPGSATAEHAWPAGDRRRYPRYPCSGTITLREETGTPAGAMRLVDLSLGGCYGESLSPLPVGAAVALTLNAGEVGISAKAVVRTRHVAMGNGFAFTEIGPDEWKKLAQLVQQLGSGNVVSNAASHPEMIDGLEALITILQRKGVLSRNEVVIELERRRSAH